MTKEQPVMKVKQHTPQTPTSVPANLLTIPYDVLEQILSYCIPTHKSIIDTRQISLDMPCACPGPAKTSHTSTDICRVNVHMLRGHACPRPATPNFPLDIALTCQRMYWETTEIFSRLNKYKSNADSLLCALKKFEHGAPGMITRHFTTACWLQLQKLQLDCCTIDMWIGAYRNVYGTSTARLTLKEIRHLTLRFLWDGEMNHDPTNTVADPSTMHTKAAVKTLRGLYLWRIFNVPHDGTVLVKGVLDPRVANFIQRACHSRGISVHPCKKSSQPHPIWPKS